MYLNIFWNYLDKKWRNARKQLTNMLRTYFGKASRTKNKQWQQVVFICKRRLSKVQGRPSARNAMGKIRKIFWEHILEKVWGTKCIDIFSNSWLPKVQGRRSAAYFCKSDQKFTQHPSVDHFGLRRFFLQKGDYRRYKGARPRPIFSRATKNHPTSGRTPF